MPKGQEECGEEERGVCQRLTKRGDGPRQKETKTVYNKPLF